MEQDNKKPKYPDFDGELIANKGEGWKDELYALVEYVFQSKKKGNQEGVVPFLVSRIKRICDILSTNESVFADFASFLFDQFLRRWGSDKKRNYQKKEGVPFVNYLFNRKCLWKKWSDFCKLKKKEEGNEEKWEVRNILIKTITPNPSTDNQDKNDPEGVFIERIPSKPQENRFNIIELTEEWLEEHYEDTDFPDDDAVMLVVQLFPKLIHKRKKYPLINKLIERVLPRIGEYFSMNNDQNLTPEELLLKIHKEADDKIRESAKGLEGRGSIDPAGNWSPDRRDDNSQNTAKLEFSLDKFASMAEFWPITSPEILKQLPGSFGTINRRIENYILFLLTILLPITGIQRNDLESYIREQKEHVQMNEPRSIDEMIKKLARKLNY